MDKKSKIQTECTCHQGYNVKRLRHSMNWTQAEFGQLVGMSVPTVSRYESQEKLEPEILDLFSKILRVDKAIIMNLKKDEPVINFQHNTFAGSNLSSSTENQNHVEDSKNLMQMIEKMCGDMKEQYTTIIQDYKKMYEESQAELRNLREELNKRGTSAAEQK